MAADDPTMRYASEGLEEEEHIIEERTAPARRQLDENALHEPISTLPYVPPLNVTPQTSVAEAVRLMQEQRVGCVLVQEAERLVGIFTERDLLNKVLGGEQELSQLQVGAVMTADPEALPTDAPLAFALNLMGEGGFRRLPLVDEAHRPVGMLSVKHIISYLAEFFPEAVLNLPPRAELLHPGEIDGG